MVVPSEPTVMGVLEPVTVPMDWSMERLVASPTTQLRLVLLPT